MELANGKTNKLFSLESDNKYWFNDFDINETQGMNNVLIFVNQVNTESTVLDVGCAYGKMGQELKKKNCIVYGIDKDKVAADMAINNGYKDVFLFDVEDYDSDEYHRMENTIGKVDTIIFSDVFEHLVDPTGALLKYMDYLKNDGNILVSVPNIAHMDIVLHLMNGEFNYTDMGILDNTHLKFFTQNSFLQWIQLINDCYKNVNLDCEYLGGTFYENDYIKDLSNKYNELYKVLQKNKDYNTLQLLFKLTKKEECTLNRDLLLSEEKNVVDVLGEALKGKVNIIQNSEVSYGQRLWYENKIKRIDEYQKCNLEQSEFINNQKAYIIELESSIKDTLSESGKKSIYIQELEHSVKEINEENIKRDDYIQELEKNITEALFESNKRSKYIQEMEGRLEELNIEINKKNDYILELENKNIEFLDLLSKKDIYISEIEQSVYKHIEMVTTLEEGIKWHQNKELEMEKEKEDIKNEINKFRAKIFEMENSLSWKVTKFLRK